MVENKDLNMDLESTAELPQINPMDFPEAPAEIEKTSNGGNDVPPNDNKKSKKSKKHVFKRNMTPMNIVLTILTVAVNILVMYILFNTTRFSAVSKDIFLKVNIFALIALVVLDILLIITMRTKKIYMFVISLICGALFIGVGGYGTYALTRVNNSINNLTATTVEEEVSASFVIYSGTDGDPITSIADLEGRTVGVSSGTKTADIAETRLENEGVNAEFVSFAGYQEVLTKLLDGTIDCAVLPVSYQSQFSDDPAIADYLSSTSSILDFSDTVSTTNASGADKDITKEPFTVLVTGENEGLADTIIVMSVNPVSMEVVMTSIARDSYVPITCYGGSSKINSAHAVSEACMVSTVEALMNIEIDYTIEFNFASVIQVVDAVGGVDLYVEASFDAQSWDVTTDSLYVIPLEEGYQHLNGMQALGYARERYAFSDGDFARQRHQQEIIEQVVEKLMATRDPNTFLDILDAAGDNIKTNFTVEQMTSFINYALSKSKRYYNQDSVSGLFNFVSSRVYGYSVQMWDDSLQMYLYTYYVFNGSVEANRLAILRNSNLYSAYSTPTNVSWSASTSYTPDPISAEYYANEVTSTVIGGPGPENVETEEDPNATLEPTVEPIIEPDPTPEVVDPTPEVVDPIPEPVVTPDPTPVIEEPTDSTTEG